MTTQEQLLKDILIELRALRAATETGKHGYNWTPDGLPICPRHGEVMPRREKQGDEWFSHKVTDEHGQVHYCRGYASKNSPGWDVTLENTPLPAAPPEPPPTITLAAARSAVVAQPIQTDRTTFYEKASAAVNAGKIQFDKFNALVSKANRHGYAAALEELQGIV